MFSHPKILFLVSLLFVAVLNSIPTYLLNFEFFIILVCFSPTENIIYQGILKIEPHINGTLAFAAKLRNMKI